MRLLAAYLLAPAIFPLAALFYSVFFALPPCPNCSIPNWAYALPAAFFTYPAALIIGMPTVRLLPIKRRSPLVGPPLAGAGLALLVFSLFAYGIKNLPQLALAAIVVVLLGAISASIFVLLLGTKHTNALDTTKYTVRDYLPFFGLFLAVEGGAYFGQFSCGGYAIIREIFDLILLGTVIGISIFGRGFLTSAPRRLGFFLGTLVLFSITLAVSSTFYPGPPSSLGEFFKSFVSGLLYGPC